MKNITQQQKIAIAQSTEQTEPWLDLILANLSEGVFVVSEEMKVLYANDAFAEIAHRPRMELIGLSLWELMPLPNLARSMMKKGSRQVISAEGLLALLGEHNISSGKHDLYIDLDASRIPGVEQIVFVVHDITSYRKTRTRLEQSYVDLEAEKVRIEAILSHIGEGLVTTDHKGRIQFINRAALDMLGGDKEEMTGKLYNKVIRCVNERGQEIPQNDRPLYQALTEGKRTFISTYYYFRKDGNRFPVAITASPLITHKKIAGAIMVFRDITLEKNIDRAKSEFVSLASHEMRTPLSYISWYAEKLLSGDAGKITVGQRKFLEEIYAGNRRMVNLVNDLLSISRIELGTFVIDPKPLDLRATIQSILDEVAPSIAPKELTIRKKIAEGVGEVVADPKLVRMIVHNLISNAIKYTPERGKVTVVVSQKDQDVLIKVKDTGYGIPQYQLPQMFTKLFRADNVRELGTEGTGLGLYLVKSVITQVGGRIWFTTKENKGTTFYVKFPLTWSTVKV